MMEVKRHSLEGVRRSDKMFSPEGGGLSPPISTGLSLGIHGIDSTNTTSLPSSTGYLSSVTSMRTPLPNAMGSFEVPPMAGAAVNRSQSITPPPLVPVGDGDFMSLSPAGIISGNQAVFLPPSIELPPFISATGVGTIPAREVPVDLQNEAIVSGQSMENLSRDAPSDTAMLEVREKCAWEVDPKLSMATGSDLLESDTGLHIGYNDGETQVVSDTEGFDVMAPPLAGETQPINDAFDDMVVLQNDTLAASSLPLENSHQPASLFEPVQIVDTPPLEAPSNVTTSAPSGITKLKVSPTHQEYERGKDSGVESQTDKISSEDPGRLSCKEGPSKSLLHTEGQAAHGEQASKEEVPNVSDPQGLLDDGLSEKARNSANKGDESTPSQNGNAGSAGSEKKKVVSENDIKALVGRRVLKKFGRKIYEGKVVDFDSENQWFKVVYEDGDQEDLELEEVKNILLVEEISTSMPTSKRKRQHAEEGPRKQARKHKQPKGQGSGKSKGRSRKKDSSLQMKKPPAKVKSSSGSIQEGSEPGSSPRTGSSRKLQSQKTSGGKRKRSADEETKHEARTDVKVKKGGKTGVSTTKKSMRKSPPKKPEREVIKKDSSREKTRGRSLSQLPAEQKKVSPAKSKGKQQKVNASGEDEDALVGKTVEKEFDGILYKGKVTKFDKETLYYKVKYEDGDQEDLELEELKAVLEH